MDSLAASGRAMGGSRLAPRRIALVCMLFLLFAPMTIAFAQAGGDKSQEYLAGGSRGLYRVSMRQGKPDAALLWEGGSVRSIVPSSEGWYFLTSIGLVFSADLRDFENRSISLPVKLMNISENGAFSPKKMSVTIQSLAVDPAQPGRLALCTSDEVWYSDTSGRAWLSLGAPSLVQGMKAVAFGPWPGAAQHAVWVSHAIKGVFVRDVGGKNGWLGVSSGVPKIIGTNTEEVSSFALIASGSPTGIGSAPAWSLYGGMSFLGKIIQWDPQKKAFIERFSDGKDFGTIESLVPAGQNAGFALSEGAIQRVSIEPGAGGLRLTPDIELTSAAVSIKAALLSTFGDAAACLALIPSPSRGNLAIKPPPVAIGELWLLPVSESAVSPGKGSGEGAKTEQNEAAKRRSLANNKASLYLQTGFVINPATRAKYFALMKTLGLDSLVVDMKDDYGRLRFSPRSPLLAASGGTGELLDIESFAAEAKTQGIYLIARIVVFKDEALYKWKNGALAVRDAATGLPWRGVKPDGQPIQEFWVDPYSTDVWRYNVEIAKEVTARGFDEVQFDYIRFPTDGENLSSARFPSSIAGMTPDSALESFLRFARQELALPISVDIYGANGWYRSGTRTGQAVEMLADYVDVICPMLYPSHFEQAFMAQAPAELRPYRIYKLGTLRNLAIARGRVLVRPYVQAFYLDVSYDKAYYSPAYVEQEVRGVREGANQGMTFWNNSGRYDDLPVLR